MATLEEQLGGKNRGDAFKRFPWWLVAIIAFLALMVLLIITNPEFNQAFQFIKGSLGSIDDLPGILIFDIRLSAQCDQLLSTNILAVPQYRA